MVNVSKQNSLFQKWMAPKNWSTHLIYLCVILVAICFSTFILLTIAYSIPNAWIQENWEQSVSLIASETKRWEVIPHIAGTKLDTFTDNLMFQKLTNLEQNTPWYEAMWNAGYVRYWFAIIGILRPLLIFMGYSSIRYLNIFLVIGTLVSSDAIFRQKMGKYVANSLLLIFLLIHAWIFPLSLQYTPIFIVTLLSSVVICMMNENMLTNRFIMGITFFIIGSLANVWDLLTVPLLSFSIPFSIWFILLMQRKQTQSVLKVYGIAISNAVHWGAGYALTWVSKWAIGSIVLQENIFHNAIQQMSVRTAGTSDEVLNYGAIVARMWGTLLPTASLIVLVLFVLYSIYQLQQRQLRLSVSNIIWTLPMIANALLPFIWVFVLKNHNQHHYYFTYRIFAISLFSLIIIFRLLFQKVGDSLK